MALTFEQLILKVLKETKKALSADEIWDVAYKKGTIKNLEAKEKLLLRRYLL